MLPHRFSPPPPSKYISYPTLMSYIRPYATVWKLVLLTKLMYHTLGFISYVPSLTIHVTQNQLTLLCCIRNSTKACLAKHAIFQQQYSLSRLASLGLRQLDNSVLLFPLLHSQTSSGSIFFLFRRL